MQKSLHVGIKNADVIILNYCNSKDLRYLKKFFSNNLIKKYLFNFSYKNKDFFG